MVIKVCIGSACHLKGSYEVIRSIERYLERHQMLETVKLESSFCLGRCAEAVSVAINDEKIVSMSPQTVDEVMDTILKG